MTAKDILIPADMRAVEPGLPRVDASIPLLPLLHRLLESPEGRLAVADEGIVIGSIDSAAMLRGLGRLIADRDDCCIIVVECRPDDYSASLMAHAIEDCDAHLVDLLTTPADDGSLRVTLRVRCYDPSAAVHSLERYDFRVVDSYADNHADLTVAAERLLALQTLLNV